jgi:hypothetical protein
LVATSGLALELRSLGAGAEFVQADVRNEADVRRLVDGTVERATDLVRLSTACLLLTQTEAPAAPSCP